MTANWCCRRAVLFVWQPILQTPSQEELLLMWGCLCAAGKVPGHMAVRWGRQLPRCAVSWWNHWMTKLGNFTRARCNLKPFCRETVDSKYNFGAWYKFHPVWLPSVLLLQISKPLFHGIIEKLLIRGAFSMAPRHMALWPSLSSVAMLLCPELDHLLRSLSPTNEIVAQSLSSWFPSSSLSLSFFFKFFLLFWLVPSLNSDSLMGVCPTWLYPCKGCKALLQLLFNAFLDLKHCVPCFGKRPRMLPGCDAFLQFALCFYSFG